VTLVPILQRRNPTATLSVVAYWTRSVLALVTRQSVATSKKTLTQI
jgi:hypothetical protein